MSGSAGESRTGRLAGGLGLPHAARDYACAPGESWAKLREWLNGCWQLRACSRRGRWPRVRGRLQITNRGEFVLGERVRLHSHYARSLYVTLPNGRLEIGDGTFVNYGADIAATCLVRIGSDCLIGTHCMILDSDFHDLADRSRRPESRPVLIGDRVWIGNRVLILPGTRIGDDAVIGAGSVVKGEIPAGAIAAGNPARVIRQP